MKTILISAIGGDIGYAVIKALRESGRELYFIGFDITKYNASYDLVDEFYLSPQYKEEEKWLDFVTELLSKHHVDYFWPITEPEITLVDKNRNKFHPTSVIINEPNVLHIALDKSRTASFLKAGGVHVPETWDRPESVRGNYPLIVKEAFGCGSHSIRLVHTKSELEQAFGDMQNPVIQEYIGDASQEYTLTVFSDQKVVNYIAFRRTLGFGGMSRYVELADDKEIRGLAHTLAGLFSLKGSVNVQMRKQNGKYYVFEINPRISSTMGFRAKLGFNDAAWWLDQASGKPVEPFICPVKAAFGVRTVEEKIFTAEENL